MHSPHRLVFVFFALNASLMAQSDPVPFCESVARSGGGSRGRTYER